MSNLNAIYNLNGVPLFTYGMIGLTTVVLAVVTMMDNDNKSFAKDDGYKTSSQSSSMFGNVFGTPTNNSNQSGSMFGNVFGTPTNNSNQDSSILGTSSNQNTNKPNEDNSMFGNMFGTSSNQNTNKPNEDNSMFGNMFGTSNKKSNQDNSMFGYDNDRNDNDRNDRDRGNNNRYENEDDDIYMQKRNDDSMYRMGGKSTKKKTKHNRRQNTYTRKL